jgi:hypothetical protein
VLARELGADIVIEARADDPATVLQAHGHVTCPPRTQESTKYLS